jgi:type IV secretory pathway VirB4 component
MGRVGVIVGVDDWTGQCFRHDEWALYDEQHNPATVIAGAIGSGKSSLAKTMIGRGWAVYGRRAVVVSPKPAEYGPLAESMGAVPVVVGPGGTPLNPLEAPPGVDGVTLRAVRLAALVTLTEIRLRRDLRPYESLALGVAVDEASRSNTTPAPHTVAGLLLDPTPGMVADVHDRLGDWTTATRELAAALVDLLAGPYGTLLAGSGRSIDFDAPLVVLDVSSIDMAGPLGRPLLATVVLSRLRLRLAARPTPTRLLWEEAWSMLRDTASARFAQEAVKLGRSLSLASWFTMHRPGDLSAIGDAGTQSRAIAEGLLADAGTKIVYRPESHERAATARLLGLTPAEESQLATLAPGVALWKVGDVSTVVHHRRVPWEVELTDTDAAMRR